ncbi:Lar family restriction alleviation protein [Brevundimonas diminuta]
MTPREKVKLKPCPFCGGEAWLNDYEAKHSDLPPKSRSPQCRSCGASLGYLTTPVKATEAWNRRTALASGSGDHAELARLAEAATPGPWVADVSSAKSYASVRVVNGPATRTGKATILRMQTALNSQHAEEALADAAFIAAANPATVLALLAENAALRVKAMLADVSYEKLERRTAALDEAERKLAEAVGLLAGLFSVFRGNPARHSLMSWWARSKGQIEALINKEAERG